MMQARLCLSGAIGLAGGLRMGNVPLLCGSSVLQCIWNKRFQLKRTAFSLHENFANEVEYRRKLCTLYWLQLKSLTSTTGRILTVIYCGLTALIILLIILISCHRTCIRTILQQKKMNIG